MSGSKKRLKPRVFAEHKDDGRTVQSHRALCDINNLVAQAKKGGVINHFARLKPFFGDATLADGLHDALNKQIAARDAFSTLPAKVRERYGNDMVKFVAALQDPAELDFLCSVGILSRSERVQAAAASAAGGAETPKPDKTA